MNKKPGKTNIFLLLGICIILITVGVLVFKTIQNYRQILREKGEDSIPQTGNQAPFQDNASETKKIDNSSQNQEPLISVMPALENKSILMVIAYKDFRDEEYLKTKYLFQVAGGKIKTASTQKGTAVGADGNTVEVDVLIKDANLADYDAVIFIGGSGALTYLDNEDSYKLARETIADNKVLGSICISPVVLAKAGVLKGKKATVWTSLMDKSAVKILEENGATFQDKSVIADGKIITGNGPDASDEFAMKIIEILIQ